MFADTHIFATLRLGVMLGLIQNAFEAFIRARYGEPCWNEILERSRVDGSWVSSCPYSDGVMYE